MTNLSDPILVADQTQFLKTVSVLSQEPIISVDTESNSLFAYRERVCLIQFSIPGADYLVDPFDIEDLSQLGEIFSNPEIEKIFHAAEYDLLCLKRDYDFKFANLFDTMVAARILGRKKVGLGNLLKEEFRIELQKRFQKADWGKRPLPKDMQSYARFDTHYLIRLRDKYRDELIKAVRWPIAEEDFSRLSFVNGTPPGPVDTNIWRIHRSRDLSPEQAAVLQELVNYRDKKAESTNSPPFKVIGDKILLTIAENNPRSLQELNNLNSVPSKLIHRHGKGLISAVKRGENSPKISPPPRQKINNGFPDRLEILRDWRKKQAIKMGVESDIVLPRDLMLKIASETSMDKDKLNSILNSAPWRLKKYGNQIQSVMDKTY